MKTQFSKEYNDSIDALRFSDQAKEAMIQALMAESRPQKKGQRRTMKKAMLVVLAAVMLIATLTGAAVFTRWSKALPQTQRTSQHQREEAEKSGLSVSPAQNTEDNSVTSVTDQGVTISVEQTIVDKYTAELVFKISGFDLPDGQEPFCSPSSILLDGKDDFYSIMGGDFYDHTTHNDNGEWVYEDGTPVATDENGCAVLHYADQNGNLEYAVHINARDDLSQYFGKEIQFSFDSLGISSGKAMYTPTLKGNWTLRWTFDGNAKSRTVTVEKPIGDTGIILKEAEISSINLEVQLQLKEHFDGFDTLEPFRPYLVGVRCKDGTVHRDISGGKDSYEDPEKELFRLRRGCNGILEPENVDAILFEDYDPDTQEQILYTVELP